MILISCQSLSTLSIYPEYIPLEDEHILSAEEQPLPPIVSPTAESLGYVVESDPEEDLEECTAPAGLPSPPLPPSLHPPPPVDHKDDIPESEQPRHKRFANTIEAEMRHQGIGEVGYGIRDTWIDPVEAVP
nr:hypothetical protein [Tanacetum cinerariifolium]